MINLDHLGRCHIHCNSAALQEDQEEPPDASAHFSRQRQLPLHMDDEVPPLSEVEADSHEKYYMLLESVERETIAPIKQEWFYNVCGQNSSLSTITFWHSLLLRITLLCFLMNGRHGKFRFFPGDS